jgi:hypothetical protein
MEMAAECCHSGSDQGETRRHRIGSSNGKCKSSHHTSLGRIFWYHVDEHLRVWRSDLSSHFLVLTF